MLEGRHLGFQLGDLPVSLTLSLERSNILTPGVEIFLQSARASQSVHTWRGTWQLSRPYLIGISTMCHVEGKARVQRSRVFGTGDRELQHTSGQWDSAGVGQPEHHWRLCFLSLWSLPTAHSGHARSGVEAQAQPCATVCARHTLFPRFMGNSSWATFRGLDG